MTSRIFDKSTRPYFFAWRASSIVKKENENFKESASPRFEHITKWIQQTTIREDIQLSHHNNIGYLPNTSLPREGCNGGVGTFRPVKPSDSMLEIMCILLGGARVDSRTGSRLGNMLDVLMNIGGGGTRGTFLVTLVVMGCVCILGQNDSRSRQRGDIRGTWQQIIVV
ncbi:hypothetical protein B0H16DRAFT_1461404 [Mycena metata]|uniref:Uncharacterized protein n=1 Tax=Mycena metata TaxID=1033252 RepID=A0AAD7N7G5_9AGAR|nr:hypothetical protein B0H16DRAFT_1461404 [Mycena metata]